MLYSAYFSVAPPLSSYTPPIFLEVTIFQKFYPLIAMSRLFLVILCPLIVKFRSFSVAPPLSSYSMSIFQTFCPLIVKSRPFLVAPPLSSYTPPIFRNHIYSLLNHAHLLLYYLSIIFNRIFIEKNFLNFKLHFRSFLLVISLNTRMHVKLNSLILKIFLGNLKPLVIWKSVSYVSRASIEDIASSPSGHKICRSSLAMLVKSRTPMLPFSFSLSLCLSISHSAHIVMWAGRNHVPKSCNMLPLIISGWA